MLCARTVNASTMIIQVVRSSGERSEAFWCWCAGTDMRPLVLLAPRGFGRQQLNRGYSSIGLAHGQELRSCGGSWSACTFFSPLIKTLQSRRHGTDIYTELCQTVDIQLTSFLSVAQYHQAPTMLPDGAVWRRCSRVRVVSLLPDFVRVHPGQFRLWFR